VGTTAFEKFQSLLFRELYSRFQSPGFRIPQGKVPSFRNPDSLTLSGFKSGLVRVGLLWDKQRGPFSQKEHIEISNILKFGVYQAYIERDTAIQKLQNLQKSI